MTRLVTDPSALGDEPLGAHALSHIMSDLIDNFVETDEEEIRISLCEAGYRSSEVAQIMKAWAAHVESTPRCSTCGGIAQAMWASISEVGEVSSSAGRNKMVPSCFQCGDAEVALTGGVDEAQVMAPLGWDSETLVMRNIQWPDLADIIAHSDPDQGLAFGEALARADSAAGAEWISAVIRGLAHGASTSGHADSYDAVIVNCLVNATR